MATEAELRYVISVQDKELKALKKELGATGRTAGGEFNKGMARGGEGLKKLNRTVNVVGAALVAGLAVGLKKSIDAAKEAQVVDRRMQAQLGALGISYTKHAKKIDEVITSQSKLSALDDEDLTDSFTNLVRVTEDVNKALELNALAADFARAKGIDVAKAGELIGKVAGGNTGILARYGITLKEGATTQEALATLQRKFAGQAEAYGSSSAGASERAQVAAENLAESFGEDLLPQFNGLLDIGTRLIGWSAEHKTETKLLIGAVLGLVAATKLIILGYKLYTAATIAGTAANRLLNGTLKAQRVLMATSIVGAIILVGVALFALWKKSETFRNIVKGAIDVVRVAWEKLKDVAGIVKEKLVAFWDVIGSKVVDVVQFIILVIDKWMSAYSLLIRATGKVADKFLPGSPFADAADAIDATREKVRGLGDAIESLKPKKVNVTVGLTIKGERFGVGSVSSGDIGAADVSPRALLNGAIGDGVVDHMRRHPGLIMANLGGFLGSPISELSPALWGEAGLARQMGLQLSSIYRPGATVRGSGAKSDHSYFPSKAFDAAGPGPSMIAFARSVAGLPGVDTVIHSALGRSRGLWKAGIGWIPITSPQTYADHFSHVHVDTFDSGGWLAPRSTTLAINRTPYWEPVGPPGRGGGGGTIVFQFPNYVGNQRELAAAVREEFEKYDRRNGSR